MKSIWIFLLIGLFGAIWLYVGKKRIQRKAACFALYKVRDDLICLVAEGKLDESSQVFQYYYKRINNLLVAAPHVGHDDVQLSLISQRNNKEFDKVLEQARREAESIRQLKEMRLEEVRQVVASHYKAVSQLMLAHSSLSRFLFLRLMHQRLLPLLEKTLPALWRELRIAKFADSEYLNAKPQSG